MLNMLIYNIFILFGARGFQQTIGIPMGTNSVPLPSRRLVSTCL
jgi:hypothetical protein